MLLEEEQCTCRSLLRNHCVAHMFTLFHHQTSHMCNIHPYEHVDFFIETLKCNFWTIQNKVLQWTHAPKIHTTWQCQFFLYPALENKAVMQIIVIIITDLISSLKSSIHRWQLQRKYRGSHIFTLLKSHIKIGICRSCGSSSRIVKSSRFTPP